MMVLTVCLIAPTAKGTKYDMLMALESLSMVVLLAFMGLCKIMQTHHRIKTEKLLRQAFDDLAMGS